MMSIPINIMCHVGNVLVKIFSLRTIYSCVFMSKWGFINVRVGKFACYHK